MLTLLADHLTFVIIIHLNLPPSHLIKWDSLAIGHISLPFLGLIERNDPLSHALLTKMDRALIGDLDLLYPAKPAILMTVQCLHSTPILQVCVELIILRIEDLVLVSQSPLVMLVSLEMDLMVEFLLKGKDGCMMEGGCALGRLGECLVDQL